MSGRTLWMVSSLNRRRFQPVTPAERARQKARHHRLQPWLIAQTVNNRLPLSVPTLLTRMVCQFLSR